MKFKDKTILITGASSGIGKALAYELAKEKCILISVARRIELLNEIKNDLESSPAKIYAYQCDVRNKDEVKATYEKIQKDGISIDIAVLNAGVGYRMTVNGFNSGFAEDTIGVNLFGIIYWVEQLLPDFLNRKSGTIVGVSSMADNRGFSGSGFYCASKAATTIYLEGLRVELKPEGIEVITLKPGFVKTPMTDKNDFPMPFLMSAKKAAEIIAKGIRKEKRIIQFPLRMMLLSKFIGWIPGRIYEFLAIMHNKYFKK